MKVVHKNASGSTLVVQYFVHSVWVVDLMKFSAVVSGSAIIVLLHPCILHAIV